MSVRLYYLADMTLFRFRSQLEAFRVSCYTDKLWYKEIVCHDTLTMAEFSSGYIIYRVRHKYEQRDKFL